jgi:hypothetical protein
MHESELIIFKRKVINSINNKLQLIVTRCIQERKKKKTKKNKLIEFTGVIRIYPKTHTRKNRMNENNPQLFMFFI